jgi:hypothetical protein
VAPKFGPDPVAPHATSVSVAHESLAAPSSNVSHSASSPSKASNERQKWQRTRSLMQFRRSVAVPRAPGAVAREARGERLTGAGGREDRAELRDLPPDRAARVRVDEREHARAEILGCLDGGLPRDASERDALPAERDAPQVLDQRGAPVGDVGLAGGAGRVLVLEDDGRVGVRAVERVRHAIRRGLRRRGDDGARLVAEARHALGPLEAHQPFLPDERVHRALRPTAHVEEEAALDRLLPGRQAEVREPPLPGRADAFRVGLEARLRHLGALAVHRVDAALLEAALLEAGAGNELPDVVRGGDVDLALRVLAERAQAAAPRRAASGCPRRRGSSAGATR